MAHWQLPHTSDAMVNTEKRLVPQLCDGPRDHGDRDQRRADAGTLRVADNVDVIRLQTRFFQSLLEDVEYVGLMMSGSLTRQKAFDAKEQLQARRIGNNNITFAGRRDVRCARIRQHFAVANNTDANLVRTSLQTERDNHD